MILILGKGTLALALRAALQNSVCVGRPEFDLGNQQDCDRLINSYDPAVVINTVAVNQHADAWDILTTNYVSAVYLTLGFYNKMTTGQIINISSTSTLWVSYPGIGTGRLIYNISKENLSLFGRHLNRQIVDNNKSLIVSTAEIGHFPSKFNNYKTGGDLDAIVNVLVDLVNRPKQQVTFIK
jgi:short-subunit dehydrogenase